MTQSDKSRRAKAGSQAEPDPEPAASEQAVRAARPALLLAGIVLGLEAVSVVGYGILIAANLHNVVAGIGYGVAGMLIVWGIVLALVGRGVALARHWARGPAVALQLFQFPLAWGFRQNLGWLAVALFVTAAVVLVCVFLPASTAAFTSGRKLPGREE